MVNYQEIDIRGHYTDLKDVPIKAPKDLFTDKTCDLCTENRRTHVERARIDMDAAQITYFD